MLIVPPEQAPHDEQPEHVSPADEQPVDVYLPLHVWVEPVYEQTPFATEHARVQF